MKNRIILFVGIALLSTTQAPLMAMDSSDWQPLIVRRDTARRGRTTSRTASLLGAARQEVASTSSASTSPARRAASPRTTLPPIPSPTSMTSPVRSSTSLRTSPLTTVPPSDSSSVASPSNVAFDTSASRNTTTTDTGSDHTGMRTPQAQTFADEATGVDGFKLLLTQFADRPSDLLVTAAASSKSNEVKIPTPERPTQSHHCDTRSTTTAYKPLCFDCAPLSQLRLLEPRNLPPLPDRRPLEALATSAFAPSSLLTGTGQSASGTTYLASFLEDLSLVPVPAPAPSSHATGTSARGMATASLLSIPSNLMTAVASAGTAQWMTCQVCHLVITAEDQLTDNFISLGDDSWMHSNHYCQFCCQNITAEDQLTDNFISLGDDSWMHNSCHPVEATQDNKACSSAASQSMICEICSQEITAGDTAISRDERFIHDTCKPVAATQYGDDHTRK